MNHLRNKYTRRLADVIEEFRLEPGNPKEKLRHTIASLLVVTAPLVAADYGIGGKPSFFQRLANAALQGMYDEAQKIILEQRGAST